MMMIIIIINITYKVNFPNIMWAPCTGSICLRTDTHAGLLFTGDAS